VKDITDYEKKYKGNNYEPSNPEGNTNWLILHQPS
jgi:hypothetical protein